MKSAARGFQSPQPRPPSERPPRPEQSVRERYDFFDQRRNRTEPFDEGDEQNIHAWMRALTEWAESVDARITTIDWGPGGR